MDRLQEILLELTKRHETAVNMAQAIDKRLRGEMEALIANDPQLRQARESAVELSKQCRSIGEELFPRGAVLLTHGWNGNLTYIVVDCVDDRVRGIGFFAEDARLKKYNCSSNFRDACTYTVIDDTSTIGEKKLRKAVEKRIVQVRMQGW